MLGLKSVCDQFVLWLENWTQLSLGSAVGFNFVRLKKQIQEFRKDGLKYKKGHEKLRLEVKWERKF